MNMKMNQDQITRLMAGLRADARAKVAGIKPESVEEKRVLQFIDGNNSTVAKVAEKTAQSHVGEHQRGAILAAGAPKTLAESGLLAAGFEFDDSQKRALHKLIHGKHVCLIGAAGTGKTTLVKHALAQLIYGSDEMMNPFGLRQLTGEQGPSIAMVAFTGIATQVMAAMLPAWLAPACKTIHSLLEYKPTDEDGKMFAPARNANAKLDHDIVIVDETSMLGLDLWHNLVDALRPHTRVILIGDLNQLKPVADATFFAYALSAGLDERADWSLAELTTIHRQKEAAANKIIEGAHAILNGNKVRFDDPKTDPDWRFIGFELPSKANDAHNQIAGAVKWLMSQQTPGTPDRLLFDPYQDLLLCAGNGFDENDSASFIQQSPLNGTLSRMIEPPSSEHPVYIIDAGRESKKFAVGHRIMATKNESPAATKRVTNGLTGRIIKIENNGAWKGNRALFGTEEEVMTWRREQAAAAMARTRSVTEGTPVTFAPFELASMDTSKFTANETKEDRQASHKITVQYANGAERSYTSAADVMSIQLAYAMTVHKAQGSQADTVIIVVHHAVKRQLSREWLYTGVTRARRRVIMLYTRMGLDTAVSRQQIFGASLKEKIERYRMVMDTGRAFVRLNALDLSVDKSDQKQGNYMVDGVDDLTDAIKDEEDFGDA